MSYGRARYRPRHAVSALVEAPAFEPLTLEEGKLRAGLDWAADDPRNVLMVGFIAAARAKVELDTGLALPRQTRDLKFDCLPTCEPFALPAQSTPIVEVTSIKWTNAAGFDYTVAVSDYAVDLTSGRIRIEYAGAYPSDLRPLLPWAIRVVVGWERPEDLPPLLVHAVGLLVAHYATAGRDLVGAPVQPIPFGYEDAIAPYVLEALA